MDRETYMQLDRIEEKLDNIMGAIDYIAQSKEQKEYEQREEQDEHIDTESEKEMIRKGIIIKPRIKQAVRQEESIISNNEE